MTTPLIRCQDLTLGYDRHPAVHHLNLDIPTGALLAIVGPNGAGKSTFLKALMGELRPLGGSLAKPDCPVAYLPQQHVLDRDFPMNVFELVAMGLWRELGFWRRMKTAHCSRVMSALGKVGLTGFERRPIGALSGGQLQRARFARLLLQDAPLILLDEPFTAIDARTVEDLLVLIQHWHEEGRTILAVSHDLLQVRAHFPQCLLIAREMLAYGETAKVLTEENLARARSQSVMIDEHADLCEAQT